MVRGIVDECGLYDIIEGGQRRELWLEISPQSFNVRVKAGIALTQLMIFAESAAATPAPLFAPGTGPLGVLHTALRYLSSPSASAPPSCC